MRRKAEGGGNEQKEVTQARALFRSFMDRWMGEATHAMLPLLSFYYLYS